MCVAGLGIDAACTAVGLAAWALTGTCLAGTSVGTGVVAGSTMCVAGLGVDAACAAVFLSGWTAASARLAGTSVVTDVSAGAAVVVIACEVDASAIAVGLAGFAARTTLTRFGARAFVAASTAVIVIGQRVDAGSTTADLSTGAGRLTGSALARLVGCTSVAAGSAVGVVACEVAAVTTATFPRSCAGGSASTAVVVVGLTAGADGTAFVGCWGLAGEGARTVAAKLSKAGAFVAASTAVVDIFAGVVTFSVGASGLAVGTNDLACAVVALLAISADTAWRGATTAAVVAVCFGIDTQTTAIRECTGTSTRAGLAGFAARTSGSAGSTVVDIFGGIGANARAVGLSTGATCGACSVATHFAIFAGFAASTAV